MFARVSTITGKPGQIDKVANFLNQSNTKNTKGLEAMKGAYLLVNRKTGKIMTITFWETQEAMNTSTAAAKTVREKYTDLAGATNPIVEVFEVASKI